MSEHRDFNEEEVAFIVGAEYWFEENLPSERLANEVWLHYEKEKYEVIMQSRKVFDCWKTEYHIFVVKDLEDGGYWAVPVERYYTNLDFEIEATEATRVYPVEVVTIDFKTKEQIDAN